MHEQTTEKKLTERPQHWSFGFWLCLVATLVVLAQAARAAVIYFSLPIFLNDRFAFSINLPSPIIFSIYILVMGSIIIFLKAKWQELGKLALFSFALILGGGVSNIAERIFAGHVVDYFYILNGVLNVADFYVMFGAVILLLKRR